MRFTPSEYQMIIHALDEKAHADADRAQAVERLGFRAVAMAFRDQAKAYNALAHRIADEEA